MIDLLIPIFEKVGLHISVRKNKPVYFGHSGKVVPHRGFIFTSSLVIIYDAEPGNTERVGDLRQQSYVRLAVLHDPDALQVELHAESACGCWIDPRLSLPFNKKPAPSEEKFASRPTRMIG